MTSTLGDDNNDEPERRTIRRSLNLIFQRESESLRDSDQFDRSNGSASSSSQKDTEFQVSFLSKFIIIKLHWVIELRNLKIEL